MNSSFSIYTFFALAITFVLIQSCSKTPYPCFQVLTPADSIRVGKEVRFSGDCSIDIKNYYWSFGNDKSSYGMEVSTVYDSTGTYKVELYSTSGQKTGSTSKEVVVKP